jgi:hypothetical protein
MEKCSLKNKTILLLMPNFNELQYAISEQLQKMGAKVLWFQTQRSPSDFRFKKNLIECLACKIIKPFFYTRQTNHILNNIRGEYIDYVLAIYNYSPQYRLIKRLKEKNPQLKTYIYFWDAFSTWDFRYQMAYFDYKFSFDREDCKRYADKGLRYLPLFWIDKDSINKELKYDLVHIGSAHPKYIDRIPLVLELVKQARKAGLIYFVRFASWFPIRKYSIKTRLMCFFFKNYKEYVCTLRSIDNEYPEIIMDGKLPLECVNEIEAQSRCVIDVNLDRSGVALRVIKALATGKKVITNNPHIVNEEFYRPENVKVINKNDISVDYDWIKLPFVPVDVSYLRLDNWLKYIFSN